ncbi:CopD family copper resistance protein [Luteimonas lutimaris]|uniref:Membrane protein n=1 Tax=Luteimonas lutimaris TaxID=698645 RepID=A0ABP7M9X2_9GAMM
MRRRTSARTLVAMATWYPLILLLHLSCAIVFVGAVAFEVLVLESLHRHFDHAIMERIEAAVMARVRRFMPVVVALLFLSGFALFDIRCNGFACIGSRFGWLLSIKVALAFGVLAVFVTAIRAGMRGTMDPCRFRRTHHVVLCLMAAIVVLAKLMFY